MKRATTKNIIDIRNEYQSLEDYEIDEASAEAWQAAYRDENGYVELDGDTITAEHDAEGLCARYEQELSKRLQEINQ